MIKFKIGTIFYSFEEGKETPTILRLKKFNEIKDKYSFLDKDGKYVVLTKKDIVDSYIALRPDAFIGFSIVNVGPFKDIMVSVHKFTDASATGVPYAVCRQSIYDYFTNFIRKTEGVIYTGISVSKDSCPPEVPFDTMIQCDSLDSTIIIASYIGDSLDDILKLVSKSKFNSVLAELKSKSEFSSVQIQSDGPVPKYAKLIGYSSTLQELLEAHRFMYDLHGALNVWESPFEIKDDQITLDDAQTFLFENAHHLKTAQTFVYKYDKFVNLTELVVRYCIAVYPEKPNDIYIIGYNLKDE